MPNGKTHDKVNWILLPPFAYISWDFSKDLVILLLFTVSYLFSSFMFSGDLDLVSSQSKRWGVIRFIWIPYRKFFKHRSKLTHGILLGTIVRIVYLSLVMSIFYLFLYYLTVKYAPTFNNELASKTNNLQNIFINQPKGYFIYIFLGLVAGAFAHTMADEFFSTMKRIFKKNNKKKKKKS
ncbi:MAG: metal-binding protein [Candidatus Sericytochromatia bacterium]